MLKKLFGQKDKEIQSYIKKTIEMSEDILKESFKSFKNVSIEDFDLSTIDSVFKELNKGYKKSFNEKFFLRSLYAGFDNTKDLETEILEIKDKNSRLRKDISLIQGVKNDSKSNLEIEISQSEKSLNEEIERNMSLSSFNYKSYLKNESELREQIKQFEILKFAEKFLYKEGLNTYNFLKKLEPNQKTTIREINKIIDKYEEIEKFFYIYKINEFSKRINIENLKNYSYIQKVNSLLNGKSIFEISIKDLSEISIENLEESFAELSEIRNGFLIEKEKSFHNKLKREEVSMKDVFHSWAFTNKGFSFFSDKGLDQQRQNTFKMKYNSNSFSVDINNYITEINEFIDNNKGNETISVLKEFEKTFEDKKTEPEINFVNEFEALKLKIKQEGKSKETIENIFKLFLKINEGIKDNNKSSFSIIEQIKMSIEKNGSKLNNTALISKLEKYNSMLSEIELLEEETKKIELDILKIKKEINKSPEEINEILSLNDTLEKIRKEEDKFISIEKPVLQNISDDYRLFNEYFNNNVSGKRNSLNYDITCSKMYISGMLARFVSILEKGKNNRIYDYTLGAPISHDAFSETNRERILKEYDITGGKPSKGFPKTPEEPISSIENPEINANENKRKQSTITNDPIYEFSTYA